MKVLIVHDDTVQKNDEPDVIFVLQNTIKTFSPILQEIIALGYGCGRKRAGQHNSFLRFSLKFNENCYWG